MSIESLHIALIEPEIPQNAGNIGRTCVGLGARLHFIGKLGFSLSGKDIKRAGLDYWDKLQFNHHKDWDTFVAALGDNVDIVFFSARGKRVLWDYPFRHPVCLIFGSESRGLPPSFYKKYFEKLIRIPTEGPIRSLNLATAVGIGAFEAVRQFKYDRKYTESLSRAI